MSKNGIHGSQLIHFWLAGLFVVLTGLAAPDAAEARTRGFCSVLGINIYNHACGKNEQIACEGSSPC
ncbi:MAG: hypothetical protein JRH01_20530, partial [Deltaproteobacteria bacterium]|nr:hypothetical protein [Deltaproteobacteria bacterium]